MSPFVDFMINFTVASALAFFSAICLAATMLILKPLLADLWRDFWRERP